MIEPIGASLLCSGTGLIFGCISLILSGHQPQPVRCLLPTGFMAQPRFLIVTGRPPFGGHFAPQPQPKITASTPIFLFEILILACDLDLESLLCLMEPSVCSVKSFIRTGVPV
jgi:hypothetical protein